MSSADVVIIGCGIIGISTAYYLAKNHNITSLLLIDKQQPMSFTSAQSGENYRNWWPHPAMVAFTNRSIDLLETIAKQSDNRINMTRRGYALATRESVIDSLVTELEVGLDGQADDLLRFHCSSKAASYQAIDVDWRDVNNGVDVLQNPGLIKHFFPSFAAEINNVIHVRRGGDISSQQLGMLMMDYLKSRGVRLMIASVEGIAAHNGFITYVNEAGTQKQIKSTQMINAAGPFAHSVADMLGAPLPVFNTFQQKIAFEDRHQTVPRNLPFSIDLDQQKIDWSEDDRLQLIDTEYDWATKPMPGAIHCRPDGGVAGRFIKLGWAYNHRKETSSWELPLDDHFPEIVLRGAAQLQPALKRYYDELPANISHYGGWYTMTDENWPLIGPIGPEGCFMNCAYSGFGTMASCAGGELCAAWVAGADLPEYSHFFSIDRYQNSRLMEVLKDSNKGVL
ncbi:MAG: FAD-binding oxidoreductase [Gammaproteobacteria bacterium]|nr:FAD-binding oxidoreductase [Gammaproteobacteria bacterium]